MRKLGQELGVEAMSLYNHVANKDDLLDGIVEAVHERDRPAAGGRRLEGGAPPDRDLVPRGVRAPPLGVQPDDATVEGQSRRECNGWSRSSERCGKRASRPT